MTEGEMIELKDVPAYIDHLKERISSLEQENIAIEGNLHEILEWNHSVAVCEKHTSQICIGDEPFWCAVCKVDELEAENAALKAGHGEMALQNAKLLTDIDMLISDRDAFCDKLERAELQLKDAGQPFWDRYWGVEEKP